MLQEKKGMVTKRFEISCIKTIDMSIIFENDKYLNKTNTKSTITKILKEINSP